MWVNLDSVYFIGIGGIGMSALARFFHSRGKNVAGYDLTKLFIGAHGTLGLLADVTLKLLPEPRARRTFALPVDEMTAGLAWAAATVPAWLISAGVILVQGATLPGLLGDMVLVFTLEGLVDDVAAEWAEIATLLDEAGAPAPVAVNDVTADGLWADFVARHETVARIGLPPGRLRSYLHDLDPAVLEGATWCADVGNHMLYAGVPGDAGEVTAWLDAARPPAVARGGYALLMASPHRGLDRWGDAPDGLDLMRAIKARWDPAAILNPGAFILG